MFIVFNAACVIIYCFDCICSWRYYDNADVTVVFYVIAYVIAVIAMLLIFLFKVVRPAVIGFVAIWLS